MPRTTVHTKQGKTASAEEIVTACELDNGKLVLLDDERFEARSSSGRRRTATRHSGTRRRSHSRSR